MPKRFVIADVIDFARNAGRHHGKIPVSEFERLRDYLVDRGGELAYTLEGALDESARPVVRMVVQGLLSLRCQRCLEAIGRKLELRSVLLLARDETELCRLNEDEALDVILAEPDLEILKLIEDEIILDLPASPRHAEGTCTIGGRDGGRMDRSSPFLALSQLKMKMLH